VRVHAGGGGDFVATTLQYLHLRGVFGYTVVKK
jgi:hypothetical protein